MKKSNVTNYSVEILPTLGKYHGTPVKWSNMIAIAHFFPCDYKNNKREALYAAGKFAVSLAKDQCRVFVVRHYWGSLKKKLEEVKETEEGIL